MIGSRMTGFGLGVGLAEGAAGGRLEGDVRRVHGVAAAVVDDELDVDHGEADEAALGHHRLEALLDGAEMNSGDVAADDLPS
jgi:hypothetical protein